MSEWNMPIWDDLPLTNDQMLIVEMLRDGKSQRKIADDLGKSHGTISSHIDRIRRKAASAGGTSILVDPQTNEKKLVWVKNKYQDELIRKIYSKIIDDKIQELKPRPVIKAPKYTSKDWVSFYNIGDAHIGALAHKLETGSNFNIDIAVRDLKTAFEMALLDAKPSHRGVIVDFGDGTHYENLEAKTEASGHHLDADSSDSRYGKMIDAYLDLMEFTIERALEIHKHVDVIINQGNHSRKNDIWAVKTLSRIYRKNKRVTINRNENVFQTYRFGDNLIMFHHGDKAKTERLRHVMITDYREDYGQTDNHFIWCGHVHSKNTYNDTSEITVETFNTLAEKDSYASHHGFRSKQSLTRVDMHREYGDKHRYNVGIKEVHNAIIAQGGEVEKHDNVFRVT